MRLIIAFILIFTWVSACTPAKKHRKRYAKQDSSERYYKKSQNKPVQAKKKPPQKLKSLPRLTTSNTSLLPTILNEKDQTLMILINQGKYLVGEKKIAASGTPRPDANSSHFVTLSAFYIDRTEITVDNFQKFQPLYSEKPYTNGKPCPQCPAMGINWNQARKYCQWAGKRLPSEEEWEAAARGNSTNTWPWGNEFLPQHANTFGKEDGYLSVAPVASFDVGASPYGIMDMTGNVWEWVQTKNKGLQIVKGGGWTSYNNQSKISFRNKVDAKLKNPTFGFRCQREAGL
ncbi:MAG TPA: SUMF1/EgtB/PvdO family nonheme iron enzyme [Nitrospinae bacterium]|nr:SUMF1/EgtB/PvdO family nonheme iron enzyme [Nitrospinota bacterium]